MRAAILPFCCGAFLMLATAPGPAGGQDEKKERELKAPYDEWVVYKMRTPGEKFEFLHPVKTMAVRTVSKSGETIYRVRDAGNPLPPPGSEIIDSKDMTWVVTKAVSVSPGALCYVIPRPAPKKKATSKS